MQFMERLILTGNEAVALAASQGGAFSSYAFPGAPATEIHRTFRRITCARDKIDYASCVPWSSNEKAAYETALGLSYAGKRVLVSFAHVGLNVAMDPFMASAVTGVNGGMLLTVVDDPSMQLGHSAQDSRIPAAFAQLPCLEPWDQQAAFDWAQSAFEISESLSIPVMLRMVFRLAHSRAAIRVGDESNGVFLEQGDSSAPVTKNWRSWSLQPSHARANFEALLNKQSEIAEALATGPFFEFNSDGDKSLGVIACGIGRNYVLEVFDRYGIQHPLLSIGAYPVPDRLLQEMFSHCDRILLVEDGMPVMERRLHATSYMETKKVILGRLTGHLPAFGELTPGAVARALGAAVSEPAMQFEERSHRPVATRSPTSAQPCAYFEVVAAVEDFFTESGEGRVFGDVGCFSQAEAPPYQARETCVDAGASIPMATGASLAGVTPALAVIGDVTFLHSGMAGLRDAVTLKADITILISDNRPSDIRSTSSLTPTPKQVTQIVRGLGVSKDQIHIFHTDSADYDREKLRSAIRVATEKSGPSVILCCSNQTQESDTLGHKIEDTQVLSETLDLLQYRFPAEVKTTFTETDQTSHFDMVIAGVGGQGVLPLAQGLSLAAVQSGRRVKQAETRGRTQQGESLLSHLRFSTTPIHSDLVQRGSADLLLATEPLEATRWIEFLRPGGLLVANIRPVVNIPGYPYIEEILQKVRVIPNHILLDSVHLATAAGIPAAANLVTLGAAADIIGFPDDSWEMGVSAIGSCVADDITTEMAMKALRFGRYAGRFYRALVDAGVELHDALIVSSHVEPVADAGLYAHEWQTRLSDTMGREVLLVLDESQELLSANPENAL